MRAGSSSTRRGATGRFSSSRRSSSPARPPSRLWPAGATGRARYRPPHSSRSRGWSRDERPEDPGPEGAHSNNPTRDPPRGRNVDQRRPSTTPTQGATVRNNTAKRKLAAGTPVSVVAPTYSAPGLVELLGRQGYDVIFIDCEHGPPSWDAVEDMVRAAELCDATPIVRVQSHDPSTITRALDRGAGGVQVPHVNTRAQAEAVVRHAKFAPIGHRGFAGGRSAFGEVMHDYTRRANEETMVVVMLEEVEALKNLDDILETKHVDVFFVAPGDLAQSMGHPGQMDHPAVQAAIDDAVKRIRAAGRAPGVLSTPATVRRYLDLGALFLYVSLAAVLGPGTKDFLGAFPRS